MILIYVDYIIIPKFFSIEKLGLPKLNKLETYKYSKFDTANARNDKPTAFLFSISA